MSTMQERREVMSPFPDVHIEHHRIIGVIPTVRAEYKCNGIPWYENLFAGQSTCRMESAQTHTLGMMPKITGRKQPVVFIVETVEEILEVELLLLLPFCQMEFLLQLCALQDLYKFAWHGTLQEYHPPCICTSVHRHCSVCDECREVQN